MCNVGANIYVLVFSVSVCIDTYDDESKSGNDYQWDWYKSDKIIILDDYKTDSNVDDDDDDNSGDKKMINDDDNNDDDNDWW